jgi:hypothetical protein
VKHAASGQNNSRSAAVLSDGAYRASASTSGARSRGAASTSGVRCRSGQAPEAFAVFFYSIQRGRPRHRVFVEPFAIASPPDPPMRRCSRLIADTRVRGACGLWLVPRGYALAQRRGLVRHRCTLGTSPRPVRSGPPSYEPQPVCARVDVNATALPSQATTRRKAIARWAPRGPACRRNRSGSSLATTASATDAHVVRGRTGGCRAAAGPDDISRLGRAARQLFGDVWAVWTSIGRMGRIPGSSRCPEALGGEYNGKFMSGR